MCTCVDVLRNRAEMVHMEECFSRDDLAGSELPVPGVLVAETYMQQHGLHQYDSFRVYWLVESEFRLLPMHPGFSVSISFPPRCLHYAVSLTPDTSSAAHCQTALDKVQPRMFCPAKTHASHGAQS